MRMQKCLYIRDVLTDHQYEEGLGIQRGVGVGMGHHRAVSQLFTFPQQALAASSFR